MTPADRLSHARLERRIQELERELRNVPARFAAPPDRLTRIRVGRGNLLATIDSVDYRGLASTLTPVTVIPAAVATGTTPVITDTGWTTGLSYGYLDDAASSPVFISTYAQAAGAPVTVDLNFNLFEGQVFWSRLSVSLQIGTSGNYATVYIPWQAGQG